MTPVQSDYLTTCSRLEVCVDLHRARPGARERILRQAQWVAAMMGGKMTQVRGGLLCISCDRPEEAARWLRDTVPPGHKWRVTLGAA